ncbi:hypothetical protein PPYR_00979 [Photinus pyralis]|uniref:Uncharacterized protein n=2 Tax=Photinus pyralis TaxID=7054 RepID=A0A5N4B326_PHOPY|nr:hypothetical protein PPYR_00979 [Photinus pyralis]
MTHPKKTSEHEYVRFSLRIIEDIIRNDLHTNRQIQDVFNSHIEANRETLNNERMMQQISFLKTEFNIPEKIYTMKQSQKCVNCVVAKKNLSLNCDECDVVRNPPLCYRVTELTPNFENAEHLDEDKTNTKDDSTITVMQADIGLYDSYKHSMEHTVSEVEKEEIKLDQGEDERENFKTADAEFVLLPGPLYMPKVYLNESKGGESVSVAPVSSEKNHYLLITKNVAVNTDQKSANCEASTQIETEYKATSTETDCIDQSVNFSNVPQNKICQVDLNHYDLTPQRDVDLSINKADTNLLLGDKYEIVQHKIRNLDMYTLNQFYPTSGTQTSLDRLVPLRKIPKGAQEYFINNGPDLLVPNELHKVDAKIKHDRGKLKTKERVKCNLRSGATDQNPQHED